MECFRLSSSCILALEAGIHDVSFIVNNTSPCSPLEVLKFRDVDDGRNVKEERERAQANDVVQ